MGARLVPRHDFRLALRLSIVYVAIFVWMGVYLPYWPVWLAHRGLSPSEVGILLGVSPWTRVIASPPAGRWADRSGQANRLITGLAVLLAAGQWCFAWVEGFGGLLLITVAVGFVIAPIIPLLDGLTIGAEAEGKVSYGPVRLWGSAAFIGASWAGGELLERQGEAIILWLLVGAAAGGAVVSLLLPGGERSAGPPRNETEGPVISDGSSSWSRPFVGFLVVTALLHASHAVLYAFGTQHWRTQGLDESTVGLLWALSVLAEIVLFAIARRMDGWLGPRGLWLLAGGAGVVRWAVLASTASLPWLVVMQVLHAFTYGALHVGAMAYVRRQVPAQERGRATTLYSAVGTGVALGTSLPLAGWLYGELAGGAYWVMAACSGTAVLLTVGLLQADSKPRRP